MCFMNAAGSLDWNVMGWPSSNTPDSIESTDELSLLCIYLGIDLLISFFKFGEVLGYTTGLYSSKSIGLTLSRLPPSLTSVNRPLPTPFLLANIFLSGPRPSELFAFEEGRKPEAKEKVGIMSRGGFGGRIAWKRQCTRYEWCSVICRRC